MIRLEKVKITTGIQTDVSPKAIDTQGNRLVVNPILDSLNARYVSSDGSDEFIFESVKGNIKITNSDLPSGVNKQIGSFEDIQSNTLIFFLYNSSGNHGIYRFNPETAVITTIIKNSLLNFQVDRRYRITGIGVQQDLLIWSDGFNPQRALNMKRSYTGITDDRVFTLMKDSPIFQMILSTGPDGLSGDPRRRSADTTIKVNKLGEKNIQFSYQFVFLDDEKSVIAPISILYYAEINPLDTITNTDKNTFNCIVPAIPNAIQPFIKKINFLVREGNEGAWNIFFIANTISTNTTGKYTGYEALISIAESETAKLFESIPRISKALAVHKNRVVVSADEEGFDVNLVAGNFPITLSFTQHTEAYRTIPSFKSFFKKGGARTFGLALFDSKGRSMGVFGKTKIKFDPATDTNNVIDNFETALLRNYITINLSGSLAGSPKAAYYSIVSTEEEFYDQYMQIPVVPLFFKYDNPSTNNPNGGEILINGKMYYKGVPTSSSQFNRVHLLLPKEAAFIPTTDYLVQLMSKRNVSPFNAAKLENVLEVINSQFVAVNNFGITNWSTLGSHNSVANPIFVEIFKIKQSVSNSIFYEITSRIPINTNGSLSVPAIDIYGDQYYVKDYKFNYPGINIKTSVSPSAILDSTPTKTASIETPSPTFGTRLISNESNPGSSKDTANPSNSFRSNILDYSKIDWNRGKPFAELPNPKQLNRTNVLRFSNRYLPDSSLNGMSNFDSGDEYPLPVDRTSIPKLVASGNNLIAIHQRSITTLYVEQSMIKNTEGAEDLVVTDRFIGYDRELKDKIGSYHPESVVDHLGNAFGFDVFKGVVWQYTNEGISLISNFGRKNFFAEKAKLILQLGKDTVSILGGIDTYHRELLITFSFPDPYTANNETLAYNWEKNIWTTHYSFIPDGYGKVNNKLISFKNGELWVHNENSLYNNFYGVQYGRRLKIAVNPYPSLSKNYMALHVSTNFLSSGVDPELQVINVTTEEGQSTYMKVDDFDNLEGVFYTSILKDLNTPAGVIPAGKIALRNGDDILSKYAIIELVNDHTTDKCPIQFLNVSYTDSQYTR